jgi:hypothetical protein
MGSARMALYFFDMRVGATLLVDEEGLELPNLKAVQIEAARSLGDMAQHALWTNAETILGHRMRVEVRTAPVQCSKQHSRSRLSGTSSKARLSWRTVVRRG